MRRIIFVCIGNSCRSPMAEGLFRKMLKDRYGDGTAGFEVSSAGLDPGSGPTRETIEVMRSYGVDLSDFHPRALSFQAVRDSDLILAVTRGIAEEILSTFPGSEGKTFSLGEYSGLDGDIADPYGSELQAFVWCAESIRRRLERVLERLDTTRPGSSADRER